MLSYVFQYFRSFEHSYMMFDYYLLFRYMIYVRQFRTIMAYIVSFGQFSLSFSMSIDLPSIDTVNHILSS